MLVCACAGPIGWPDFAVARRQERTGGLDVIESTEDALTHIATAAGPASRLAYSCTDDPEGAASAGSAGASASSARAHLAAWQRGHHRAGAFDMAGEGKQEQRRQGAQGSVSVSMRQRRDIRAR